MAGLVPAIHVLLLDTAQDVDARHKAGHDEAQYGGDSLTRHGRACPGHPRLALLTARTKDVDARRIGVHSTPMCPA